MSRTAGTCWQCNNGHGWKLVTNPDTGDGEVCVCSRCAVANGWEILGHIGPDGEVIDA